jgi:hypothetical protein
MILFIKGSILFIKRSNHSLGYRKKASLMHSSFSILVSLILEDGSRPLPAEKEIEKETGCI